MTLPFEVLEAARFQTPPYPCSYLPRETARLDYRILLHISPAAYEDLLRRGWRRFGREFFRPACQACQQCRSLRIPVEDFTCSRSQRRCLQRNESVRVMVQPPTCSPEHVRLYNAYHADMHVRKGWPWREITAFAYEQTFVQGGEGFAREFLYWEEDQLVGIGLADVLPTALSSVYFFHDPQLRSRGLGVFSILQQLRFCQQHGLRHQYLGYWVAGCDSMAYKSHYRPHELLRHFPADDEVPDWRLAEAR